MLMVLKYIVIRDKELYMVHFYEHYWKQNSEIVVSLITSRGLFMKYDNNDNFFHTT